MRINLRHRLISLVVAFLAAVGMAAEINAGVWYSSFVGNERCVVEQDNHYYPYGMLMGESSNILASAHGYKSVSFNPYLFGSKEYLTPASANLLDFTAQRLTENLKNVVIKAPNGVYILELRQNE